jgi:hypothetical protein
MEVSEKSGGYPKSPWFFFHTKKTLLVGDFKHVFPFHMWVVILPIDLLHDFSRW